VSRKVNKHNIKLITKIKNYRKYGFLHTADITTTTTTTTTTTITGCYNINIQGKDKIYCLDKWTMP
jgi:hypothetical protein